MAGKEKQGAEKVVNFVETSGMSLKGFTLVEGFPDLGLAGTIGAKYLVEKLKFEQIGYVDSKLLLPIIRIQDGLPLHPIRIYASKKNKLVVVLAEQIIDNLLAYPMASELVSWIKKKGIKQVISTSGVRIPEGKSIYAFASDEASKKAIKRNNIDLISAGITSGVTALLMLMLKDNKIDAFCLLGNARNNADYHAATEVVKSICAITKISIDIKPLLEEAKKVEDAVIENLKEIEEKKDGKPDSTPMYA